MDTHMLSDENELLGFGWYEKEASDNQVWNWSRDLAEIKTPGIKRIRLSFFTTYQDIIGSPQRLTVVCNGKIRSEHTLSKGFQSLSIWCDDADSIYLIVDTFRPSEHDRTSADGRSLGIALLGITCESGTLKQQLTSEEASECVPNGSPVMIQVEVSTACHLACVMCSRAGRSGGSSEHMNDAVWARLSRAIQTVDQVNILGTGEPWTHPKFLDWLEFIDNNGVEIHITTSGDLINDLRARKLGQLNHLRTLTFSIDSPDPETYFKIRGQSLKRALLGIERTLSNVSNPNIVRVHAVVMRNNLRSLSGFPSLLKGLGVTRIVLRGVNNTKDTTRDMVPEYTAEEREILINTRRSAEAAGIVVSMLPTLPDDLIYAGTGDFKDEEVGHVDDMQALQASEAMVSARDVGLSHHSSLRTLRDGVARRITSTIRRIRRLDAPLQEQMRRYLDHKIAASHAGVTKICFDPWEKSFVMRNGDVYPCEAYHLQGPIGSLADESAESLWFGEKYNEFRKNLISGKNIACRNCERRATGIHPFKRFSAEILSKTIRVGSESRITLRNAGSETWSADTPILLATARPRDRTKSRFYHASWIALDRLCTFSEQVVRPGEIATFHFLTTIPDASVETEKFQFVAENQCWLPNTEMSISSSENLIAVTEQAD